MVKPETYKVPRGYNVPRGVSRMSTQTLVKQLERAANGAWFVIANLAFTFDLLDGRKVTINKHVRLRGEQEGKLPHPNAFGRGKSATGRKNRK